MSRILIIVFALLLYSFSVYSAYSGRVVVDTNNNGVFDKTDTPLSGIVVTDGQNTVKTGKDGRFTLPGYIKTRFITITTPAGYQLEKHYIPISQSIQSYDFVLTKSERTAQDDHSFIQIADTEIHNRGVASDWTRYLREYIVNEHIAFLVHTGDICYENGLKSHIKVVNSTTMGCPVYYCIGNHDLVKGDYGEQLFELNYGPAWYSFDAGNVHYVVTPMAGGDYKPSYTKDEVYRWLKNDLAMMVPGKQLVVFNHDILTAGNDFYFGPDEANRIDLRQYNLKAWVYGHWHFNYVRNQNGVYTVCTGPPDKGGIDHSPSAFRVFNFDSNSLISTNLHYCYMNEQAVIVSPLNGQKVMANKAGHIPISVNAYYSGANVKKVTCYILEGSDMSEPHILELTPATDWNWVGEIPIKWLDASRFTSILVSAEFNNGQSATTSMDFAYTSKTSRPEIKPEKDWANFLNNVQHTGNISVSLHLPLQPAWTKNIGSNIFMTSPLIAGNRVFIASTDDNNIRECGVYALDCQAGDLIWKFRTRNSVKNSIAYDNETVFAQDAEGYLYAIDASNGKLRWEKKIDMSDVPYLAEGLIATAGVVYAGTGKCLGAFDGKTGNILWMNTAWGKGEGATTTLTLAGDVLTAGAQWRGLYAHNVRTGDLLWKYTENGMSDRGASTVLHDGKLYVISRKSLFVIAPQSGEILVRKELGEFSLDVTSTPLITGSEIIFGTADKGLLALDKESLGIKWNFVTGQSLVYTAPYTTTPFAAVETSPVLSNGIVYFGASDGYLYGVKASTGEVAWKMQTGAPVFSSVAVSGNTLVAADFSGNVYTFVSNPTTFDK